MDDEQVVRDLLQVMLGRLGYRADYVHELSRGVENGGIDTSFASDTSLQTEQLFKSFKALPGIGPYGSAHLLAMEGRHDFIAVDTERVTPRQPIAWLRSQ